MNGALERTAPFWESDNGQCSESTTARLVSELARFENQLKERIRIDKPAAMFLKTSVEAAAVRLEPPRRKRFQIVWDYRLKESRDKTSEPVVGGLWDTLAERHSLYWKCQLEGRLPQEGDVLPKEALSISKEITGYIKSCVQGQIVSSKPRIFGVKSFNDQYIVDIFETNESDYCINSVMESISIPPPIDVPTRTDADFLDETIELSQGVEGEICHDELRRPIIEPWRYMLDYEEESQEQVSKHQLGDYLWEEPSERLKSPQLLDMEMYWIDEDLDRGAEFRMNAPFMSDEPSPDESTTAYEFCLQNVEMRWKQKHSHTAELSAVLPSVSESLVLTEDIHLQVLDAYDTQYPIFTKKLATHLFIIDLPVTERSPSKLACKHKAEPQPDNITQNATYVNNSILLVNETTKMSNASKTKLDDQESSLAVTMGLSSFNNTHDAELTKHNIDEDLEELMKRKKRKVKAKASNFAFFNLLHEEPNGMADITALTTKDGAATANDPETVHSFDDSVTSSKHTIGFNSTLVSKYQKHLRFLETSTKLNVIELDLDEQDVEFIVSSMSGIMLINITSIGQVDTMGRLQIQDRLIANKKKYPRLVVIVLCESIIKRDILTTFQLALALMGVECMVTSRGVTNVCQWICEIAQTYGSCWGEEEMQWIENAEVRFLTNCGLNPFAAVQVLQQVGLFDFVCMAKEEKGMFNFLSENCITELDDLFKTQWSVK